jgi:hypothetical protein
MRHVGFQGEDPSYELDTTRPIVDYEHGARIIECFGMDVSPEELIGKRICTHAKGYAMKWDLSEAAVSERDRRARREKREPSAATPAAVGEQSVSCCCCVICGITAKNAIKHKLKGGKKNIVQAVDGYLCCRNRRCRQTIGARAKEPKEPTPTDAQTATAACDLPVPTSAATNKRRVATVVPAPSRHTFPARMAAKDAEIDEKAILINKLRSQISSMRHRSSKRDSSGCKCAYQCESDCSDGGLV